MMPLWQELYDDDEVDEALDCCPRCGAIWSMDELDAERCYACGWSFGDILEFDEEDDDV